jgi:hypothetical protein
MVNTLKNSICEMKIIDFSHGLMYVESHVKQLLQIS